MRARGVRGRCLGWGKITISKEKRKRRKKQTHRPGTRQYSGVDDEVREDEGEEVWERGVQATAKGSAGDGDGGDGDGDVGRGEPGRWGAGSGNSECTLNLDL